ncbi:PQQ-binding-like beta-propeller repeat protein [Streptomyces sp. NPDC005374]|uniref:outer membrane protein assembly factor BamB family protein n=1 Tax=Streptomyces sp. NPDC005374 TaxID=3364713 RepID=UPI0036BF744C
MRAYALDGFLEWSARMPGSVEEPPVVAENVVYVPMSGGALVTLELAKGTRLKGFATESADRRPNQFNGTAVVPADGARFAGLVVHMSYGKLVAVDPQDGSPVWTVDGQGGTAENTPTVYEGLVYALFGEKLYVVDRDGVPQRVLTLDGVSVLPEYSPVADARHVYVATLTGIAAIDRLP